MCAIGVDEAVSMRYCKYSAIAGLAQREPAFIVAPKKIGLRVGIVRPVWSLRVRYRMVCLGVFLHTVSKAGDWRQNGKYRVSESSKQPPEQTPETVCYSYRFGGVAVQINR